MASLLSFTLPKPNSIIKCSSPSSSLATQSPPQLLEEKFGRKGIRFTESGNVELTVRNGSSLSLQIADGLVTSYKPKVYWKDEGFQEILYTVASGSDSGNPTKGGVGLVLNNVSESGSGGSPCRTSEWVVKDVDSDAIDALQVELSSTNGDGTLEIRYIISLFALSMATAVIVKNNGRKAVKLSSAILTHFKFKSRRGSAVQGLKGCSYCTHPPLSSSFGIMSPADAMVPEPPSWFSLGSDSNGKGSENKVGSWTVEDNIYTTMKGKLSRVYTAPPNERLKRIYRTPPSKYETIDQGSGLGFRVIRMGYDDIYLASPGSFSQKYGEAAGEDEDTGAQIAPIVRLEEVAVTTGEEEEDVLLDLKAKLYRFDKEGNQWKERGVGTVKLLKHKENGKVRLVMRQAKTLKICANHLVLPSISIQEHAGNDKSCVWHAADFSDGELKEELFCIRFGSTENCRKFMEMVEEIAQSQEKKEENKEATSAAGLLEKLSVGESKTEEKAGEEKKEAEGKKEAESEQAKPEAEKVEEEKEPSAA